MEEASDITAVNRKCISILILLCSMLCEKIILSQEYKLLSSLSIGLCSVTSQSIRRSTEYHSIL